MLVLRDSMVHPRCSLAGTSLLGVALSTQTAFGAGQDLAVLRSYEAPGDCPAATVFMEHFASRTERVRIVSSSAGAHLSLVVTLAHEDGQVIGKLAIQGLDGMTSHRVVSAQSCDQVVPALAFVAALAADPSAQVAPASSPSASTSSDLPAARQTGLAPTAPATPSSAKAPSQASQASSQASQAPSQASQAPSQASQAPSQASQASRMTDSAVTAPHQPNPAQARKLTTHGAEHGEQHQARWRSSFIVQLGGMSGPLPTWSPLGSLLLQVEVPRSIWSMRGSFSFGVSGALPSTEDAHPGTVKFHWLTAVTGICPALIALSDQWSTAPCVIGELGMLRGAASGISVPGERTRWWRALGAAIQLRFMPETRYFVYSELAATAPLARDEFGIVNEGRFISVHRVPSSVGKFGLGAGVFW